jgi:outer membrane receptor protein involved in Fe transport
LGASSNPLDREDGEAYDSYATHDIEVAYSFDNGITLMGGGQNFTDTQGSISE